MDEDYVCRKATHFHDVGSVEHMMIGEFEGQLLHKRRFDTISL